MNEYKEMIIFICFAVFILYLIISKIRLEIRRRNKRILANANMYEVDRMTGQEFENYLEALFYSKGYRSNVTQSSYDYGADLIMQNGNKKIVIQAKRYKGKVGVKSVMEIYSAQAFYKADEAYVFTNSYFTKQAKELANATNVILCDRDAIINLRNK
ncbi:restriction endonuclease [Macrococcus sp. PK]|nr:restriction endonuclease [Macrococcus sp. PK]